MGKFGDRFVDDMIDRGRRELGGLLYGDSNIAQPMYPLRGGYGLSKDVAGVDSQGPSLADRLQEPAQEPEGPSRDDRDQGLDRE